MRTKGMRPRVNQSAWEIECSGGGPAALRCLPRERCHPGTQCGGDSTVWNRGQCRPGLSAGTLRPWGAGGWGQGTECSRPAQEQGPGDGVQRVVPELALIE